MSTHGLVHALLRVAAGDGTLEPLFDADSNDWPTVEGAAVGDIVALDDDGPRVIAPAGSPLAKVYELLARHDLNPVSTAAELAEAQAALDAPGFEDRITNYSDLPFVTIDNEDSRDLDQAIFVSETDAGFVVYYALADAAYYARPGMAIYDRALARGSSYYLPGMAVPMLPEALSEGLVSLNPGVERRAVIFATRLYLDGTVLTTQVHRALIISRAKLTYDGVQAFFDADCTGPLADQEFTESLMVFRIVGERLIRQAIARGMAEFNRVEASIAIPADNPRELRVETRERNDVERWNEQLSLLCNIEGARILLEHGRDNADLHSVFRVHLPPLEQRLAVLDRVLASIAVELDDDAWRWKRRDRQTLTAYLAQLPAGEEHARRRAAVERQILYANRASEFTEVAGPHHALAVDGYARFSSPMREVVGIFTHKELLEVLGMEKPRDRDADEELRAQVIDSANSARRLQRTLDKEVGLLAIDSLLHSDLEADPEDRPWRTGTVVGIRPTRVYLAPDEFPIDLKLYTTDLEDQLDTTYDFATSCLVPTGDAPRIRVGDAIRFRTRTFNPQRRRFLFDIEVE